MKISALLFALLLGICLLLGVILMTEETSIGHGFVHPDYPTMQRGGDGLTRHAPVLWIGWMMGVLILVFFVSLLAFGARSKRPFSRFDGALIVGGLLYVGVFSWLVLSYHSFSMGEAPGLVLAFPAPTALMLYGMGFLPLIFIGLYMFGFESWILRDEDLKAFLAELDPSSGDSESDGEGA